MKKFVLQKQPTDSDISDLQQLVGSVAAARILYLKGIKTKKDFEDLSKTFDLTDLATIYDIPSAANLIKEHIDKKTKICVYGDYDVDGMVAASILWRFLYYSCAADATVYIPSRHEEGYGLNNDAIQELYDKGMRLIITVDCGIRDAELIKEWSKKGMEFIVTDHHQPGDEIPKCIVVHPLYPKKESENMYTCGSVVAWKLVRYCEDSFSLDKPKVSENFVDLVGLALITDMMPITGENKRILKFALTKAKANPSLAIKTMMYVTNQKLEQLSTYHFGYVIGPRLNASGRVGDAYTTLRYLSTDKIDVAEHLAKELDQVNMKRQKMMQDGLKQADEQKIIINDGIILAFNEDWDDGIIGLVAGRLMNQYDMPVLAMTRDKASGLIKGSARSISNLNITEVIEGNKEEFEKYGGHHAAAGFTTKATDFEEFKTKFSAYFTAKFPDYVPETSKEVSSILEVNDVTEQLLQTIELLEPYGLENPEPIFYIEGIIQQFVTMGQTGTHVRITLENEGALLTVVVFNAGKLISELNQGQTQGFIGKAKFNDFNGKRYVQFIADLAYKKEDLITA